MSDTRALRAKAAGFVARKRQTEDPGRREALLRAARSTLAQARRKDMAAYAAAVGRGNVTLTGYREWLSR